MCKFLVFMLKCLCYFIKTLLYFFFFWKKMSKQMFCFFIYLFYKNVGKIIWNQIVKIINFWT
ncbi:hypothetical protein CEG40_00025 [Ureaplasma parvum]|nr:hypothetical protein CEG40_00025 [Ureaplasma parvum]